jgi:hydrogenase maturation protease
MKPVLVIGLGNTLMGDDGVGAEVARRLAHDSLPADVEVIEGGPDLLRWQDEMHGRRRVVLLDAVLEDGPPGNLQLFEDCGGLDGAQHNAHHLSAAQAVQLLQCAYPPLRAVRFTLIAITVASARIGTGLSPELTGRLPEIVDAVLRVMRPCAAPLSRSSSPGSRRCCESC